MPGKWQRNEKQGIGITMNDARNTEKSCVSRSLGEKNLDKNGKVLYYNKENSIKCNEEEEYTAEHFREQTGNC